MTIIHEKCYICGEEVDFSIIEGATLLREAACSNCGAAIRNSDLARVIVQTMLNTDSSLKENAYDLSSFNILEASVCGNISEILRVNSNYIGFEYFDDVVPGDIKNGVLCNDLQNLTFSENSFDLVITQDVFEHIENPDAAFKEINRVLKDGGYHIFTVPLHEGKLTLNRNCMRKVYHPDHLRKQGALVYTDWGNDIDKITDRYGMETKIISLHHFIDVNEITDVDTTYEDYMNLEPLKYYKYNSVVIVSKKPVKEV